MRDISLGVVIVAFNSGQEIIDCVESLLAAATAAGVQLKVALVDNGSTDDTAAKIRDWAGGGLPYEASDDLPFALSLVPKPLPLTLGSPDMPARPEDRLALIDSGVNRGFAGGVNVGLAWLARHDDIGHFWVLNPDTVVPPEALTALADALPNLGAYALAGGRVTYLTEPDIIQIDGGTLNPWTGVTGNLNLHAIHSDTPEPDASEMDFVTGGSMIASREFYERVGPMREDYFLYYEEVDWAQKRKDLPLVRVPGLRVYHHGGSSIGSPVPSRPASPFSLYFKHRGRMMFLRRFRPVAVPAGLAYTLAYAARLILRNRAGPEARAVLAGAFGLSPSREIRDRLGPEASGIAFAKD